MWILNHPTDEMATLTKPFLVKHPIWQESQFVCQSSPSSRAKLQQMSYFQETLEYDWNTSRGFDQNQKSPWKASKDFFSLLTIFHFISSSEINTLIKINQLTTNKLPKTNKIIGPLQLVFFQEIWEGGVILVLTSNSSICVFEIYVFPFSS